MKLRRDILLFAALAVAAVAAGWWVLMRRPGAAIETFQADLRRSESAQKAHANAQTFRATVCADQPCVVVEVGGLAFLFGAGSGSAEGLTSLGLIQSDLDGIVLADLTVRSVADLTAIAVARFRAGRTEPLNIYAPPGAVPVVDGANLLTAGSSGAVALRLGGEGEDQGESGKVVFDSGVVTIRGFGGVERGAGRTYRIDYEGKALIVAGCLTDGEDILAAVRIAPAMGIILTASDSRLTPNAPSGCLDLPDISRTIVQAHLSTGLVVQAGPGAGLPSAAAGWKEAIARDGAPGLAAGVTGAGIDLSGTAPRVIGTN